MEDKNFGLIFAKDKNNHTLAINSSQINTFKLILNDNTHYLVISCGVIDHVIELRTDTIKSLMFKLSVFILNPSEFDYMFFLNVKSEEIFGVNLENE
jgi:hypothetical protein